jgi:hypothetical protein
MLDLYRNNFVLLLRSFLAPLLSLDLRHNCYTKLA